MHPFDALGLCRVRRRTGRERKTTEMGRWTGTKTERHRWMLAVGVPLPSLRRFCSLKLVAIRFEVETAHERKMWYFRRYGLVWFGLAYLDVGEYEMKMESLTGSFGLNLGD